MKTGERAFVPRAQRFPFRFPLQYLRSGTSEWRKAKTVNISRTGILFTTADSLPLRSDLEIQVHFPANVSLACRGSVVRMKKPGVAIRIRNCRVSRSKPR
jgi:hypothetical protein